MPDKTFKPTSGTPTDLVEEFLADIQAKSKAGFVPRLLAAARQDNPQLSLERELGAILNELLDEA